LPGCNETIVAASTNRIPTFAEWQKFQQVGLCENLDHKMTVSEVRKYAEKRGISSSDAGTAAREAGCEVIADTRP
jgi:hypothetical protein